jgi:hypothetical protein
MMVPFYYNRIGSIKLGGTVFLLLKTEKSYPQGLGTMIWTWSIN